MSSSNPEIEKRPVFFEELELSFKSEYAPRRRKFKRDDAVEEPALKKVKSLGPKRPKKEKEETSPCDGCLIQGTPVLSRVSTGKNVVMFVGMYPGEEEIRQGKAFVGNSGQYLQEVLGDLGFLIDDVSESNEPKAYLTNILKCPRPSPSTEISISDLKKCGRYILEEIRSINPVLIVLMGDLPLKYFFNKSAVTPYRGQIKIKGDYKFLITYNPAYITREHSGSVDRKAFEDDMNTAWEICKGISRTRESDYVLVNSEEDLETITNFLLEEPEMSIDIECYAPGKASEKKALDPYAEGFKVLSVAISTRPHTGFCFLLEHPENKIPLDKVLSKLKLLLESDIPKYGQNIKYDYKVLAVRLGIRIGKITFDSMLAHSIIDDRKGTHNLERMALDFLGERSWKFEIGKIGTYIPKADDLCIRNCTDSDDVLRLQPIFTKKLHEMGMYNYFMSVMTPASTGLAEVEIKGLPVNRERVAYLVSNSEGTGYRDKMQVLEAKALQIPEVQEIPNFNIQSTKHLGVLLFEKYKFPSIRDTKTGKSTDKDVIEELFKRHSHPFLSILKEYREYQKMEGTYLDPYLQKWIKSDGRCHPTFTQHVAATGRLSCVRPNVQNIPVRINHAKDIMSIFFREGWLIGLADYSQIELRVLAEYSQDERMLKSFMEDRDLHATTAQELSKLVGEEISRDTGKRINFGVVYGMSAFGFAEELGVSEKEAQKYLDSYFKIFEGVKDYQDRMIANVLDLGYVETLFGRRRYIKVRDENDGHALRQAINAPIQGTATDINTIALTKLVEIYIREEFRSFPISLIHDAIMFEIHPEEQELSELNIAVMTGLNLPFMKQVKLKVDWSQGNSWAEAKG